jgi:hypothetical protein
MKRIKYLAYFLLVSNLCMAQVLVESFDGTTFPPAGWLNVKTAGSANPGTWLRLTAGTNPTATPKSGAGMAYYNAYSWSSGNSSNLITPALDFSTGSFAVTFWMYRDGGATTKFDSVSVYVNTTTSTVGGTRIGLVNRARNLAPAVATDGWYPYTFNIPTSFNTTTNYIILKATSDFGNRIYIDDVSVSPLVVTNPPTSIVASTNTICQDDSVLLTATGIAGEVYWFSNSCNGTTLGVGDSIRVSASQTTTFYAKNFANNTFSTTCASIQINVNQTFNYTINDTICAGETYQMPDGSIETNTGIYNYNLSTVFGCDSTFQVSLYVRQAIVTNISASSCNNQPFNFNGTILQQSGTYSDTLTAVNGCDSIVNLTYTAIPAVVTNMNLTLCKGDTYVFNGLTITDAGIYYDTLSATNTCDSIVLLNVSINESNTSINDSVCDGDFSNFNGILLSESGIYRDTLVNQQGCDSIVTLTLVKNNLPVPFIVTNGNLLETQNFTSYQWLQNGIPINNATNQTISVTEPGDWDYQVIVTNSSGCSDTSEVVDIVIQSLRNEYSELATIFPNPTKGFVHIHPTKNVVLNYNIYNIHGKLILTLENNTSVIDINDLPSGICLLEIKSDLARQILRLIKE